MRTQTTASMDVPTHLRQLCSTLDEFGLPRAVGHISEKGLLLWSRRSLVQIQSPRYDVLEPICRSFSTFRFCLDNGLRAVLVPSACIGASSRRELGRMRFPWRKGVVALNAFARLGNTRTTKRRHFY